MNSIVLLILVINNSAATYEMHSMSECQQVREYIQPQLAKKFQKGTYGTICLYKMGSPNIKAKN